MPTLTFTLSTAAATEMVDTLCEFYAYSPTLPDGYPNPETRADFARRMIRLWLIREIKRRRRRLASNAADATDPDITLS